MKGINYIDKSKLYSHCSKIVFKTKKDVKYEEQERN